MYTKATQCTSLVATMSQKVKFQFIILDLQPLYQTYKNYIKFGFTIIQYKIHYKSQYVSKQKLTNFNLINDFK